MSVGSVCTSSIVSRSRSSFCRGALGNEGTRRGSAQAHPPNQSPRGGWVGWQAGAPSARCPLQRPPSQPELCPFESSPSKGPTKGWGQGRGRALTLGQPTLGREASWGMCLRRNHSAGEGEAWTAGSEGLAWGQGVQGAAVESGTGRGSGRGVSGPGVSMCAQCGGQKEGQRVTGVPAHSRDKAGEQSAPTMHGGRTPDGNR